MKNSYKFALLAALGLAGITATQAYTTGDLLVGVYDTSIANTEVIDLGSFTSLFSGETWNLSSGLSLAGFGSTLNSTAQFGVVGYVLSPSKQVYATTSGGAPGTISGTSQFNSDKANISSIIIGSDSASDSLSWNIETDPLQSGLGSTLGFNVNSLVGGSGATLWALDTAANATHAGYFTLNAGTETLTYTVPEPSTYALMAGAGLTMILFRRTFRRQQA